MRNTCDRLTSETNALGKTRTYTYVATGNRTGITDRNGKTRRFTYDARDRYLLKLTNFLVNRDRHIHSERLPKRMRF